MIDDKVDKTDKNDEVEDEVYEGIKYLNEETKKFLEENGFMPDVAFMIHNEHGISPPVEVDLGIENKVKSLFSLGVSAQHIGAHEIVILMNAMIKTGDPKDHEYISKNFDTEGPATYPPHLRSEGIFTLRIDLATQKTTSYFYEYVMLDDKEKTVNFIAPLVKIGTGTAESGGMIIDSITTGYKANKNDLIR